MTDRPIDTPPPNDATPTVTSGGIESRTTLGSGAPALPFPMPDSIGGYHIIGLLGEGGMGVVWEAEQQSPRRRVAVKVVRQAQAFDPLRALMFQREAEMLGRLKHPGIAAIYESGRTGDGHGFFAMELVRGEMLDEWLAKRPSPVTRDEMTLRLRIFRSICDAVNYAHQRGVIHRDLKPSNLIVTSEAVSTTGGSGPPAPAVKILDFGLARLAGADEDGGGILTLVGVVRGTPQYMSPEQARGEPRTIDHRTDIYSLGVVLYEILTRSRPHELKGAPLTEAVRVVCDEPPRPLREAWRGTSRLDRDLETIVGKSLEKEADRRYQSAAALGEDIERYLTSQPIAARAPSRAYLARTFLRRHRVGASVATLLAVVLLAFAASMAVQARRIAVERDRANREAAAFKRVSDFMAGMFRVSDPSEARGNSVTAREILEKASNEIETGLADDPELKARLLGTIGTVYRGLGLFSKAQPLLEQSAATYGRALGPESPDTLKAMQEVGIVLAQRGHYAEAEKVGREVLEGQRRALGPEHPDLARTLSNIAVAAWYQGHLKDAEKLLTESLALSRRTKGSGHPDTLGPMNNLGLVYMDEGKFAEAEKLFKDTLELRRRISGEDHPDSLKSLLNLAIVTERQGHLADAEKLFRECLDLRRRVVGPDHPDTFEAMSSLVEVYYEEERFAEAEALGRETLDGRRRVLGPDHPETLTSMNTLANVYDTDGKRADAEPLYRETLERRRRALGPESPEAVRTMIDLAECLRGQARLDEAEKLLNDALAIQQRVPDTDRAEIGLTFYGLAGVAAVRGATDAAFADLRKAFDAGLDPQFARKVEVATEFRSLHGDPRFAAVVEEAKKIASSPGS